MPRDLKWRVDLEGEDKVTAGLQRIKKGLQDTTDATDNNTASIARQARQARQVINQDKYEAQIWLSKHERVRKLSESFSLLSRVMHVAITAQNAYNLTQLVFGQKNAERMSQERNVSQAKRELELLKARGATAKEIADASEDLAVAQQQLKEFNDQAKSQNISNILQLVTTFGYLGSSIGHIVTKAPQMISLFRRIGGFFGGAGTGGGFSGGGSFPGVSGTARPGFGGSAGGITGASPIVGGRCMSLCQETTERIGQATGAKSAETLFQKLTPWLPAILTAGVTGGLTAWLAQGDGITKTNDFLKQILDQLKTFPEVWKNLAMPAAGGKSYNVTLNDALGLGSSAGAPAKSAVDMDVVRRAYENFKNNSKDVALAGQQINTNAQNLKVDLTESLKVQDKAGQNAAQSWQNVAVNSGLSALAGFGAATAWQQVAQYGEQAATQFKTFSTVTLPNILANAFSYFGYNQSAAAYSAPASGGSSRSTNYTITGAGGSFSSVTGAFTSAKSSSSSFSVFPTRAAGFSGTVSSPTMIKVGEAGAEHVEVTPAGRGGRHGGSGGGTVVMNYYINGATKDLMRELDAHRKQQLRRRNIGV